MEMKHVVFDDGSISIFSDSITITKVLLQERFKRGVL